MGASAAAGAGTPGHPHHSSHAGDTVTLRLTEPLEQEEYSVYLRLFDRQGKDQVTVIKAQVCDCQGRVESCAYEPQVATGVPIILAVLGALLAFLSEWGFGGAAPHPWVLGCPH